MMVKTSRILLLFLLCHAPGVFGAGIVVLGDSLSAAYGLDHVQQGWVHLLDRRLREKGYKHPVINASISGETTAGGLSRLPALLTQHKPDVLVLALGANDGLRGLPLDQMTNNLKRMIQLCRQAGARVVLVGMRIPPNYGARYSQRFETTFRRLAEQERTALVPFLLEGMAEQRRLFQADQLHPTAAAQPTLLENVWHGLQPLLRQDANLSHAPVAVGRPASQP